MVRSMGVRGCVRVCINRGINYPIWHEPFITHSSKISIRSILLFRRASDGAADSEYKFSGFTVKCITNLSSYLSKYFQLMSLYTSRVFFVMLISSY